MPTGVPDPMSSRRTLDYGEITWWHQVPLRDGRVTPGQSPTCRLEPFYLFDRIDFVGRSVLDIGCWGGYFSFMAEQRGARRVVAFHDGPQPGRGAMVYERTGEPVENYPAACFD